MSNFSDYLEDKLIGLTLCRSSFTPIQTLYLALISTMNATDMASYTEVCTASANATSCAYARQLIQFVAPSGGATSNSPAITYTEAVSAWGNIFHMALCDTIGFASGNVYYHITATNTRFIDAGDTVQVAVGGITVTLQ